VIASDTPRSGSRRESAAVPATGAIRAAGRRLPARLRRRAGIAAQVARTVPSDADPDGKAA
jgi:hypothetical protein